MRLAVQKSMHRYLIGGKVNLATDDAPHQLLGVGAAAQSVTRPCRRPAGRRTRLGRRQLRGAESGAGDGPTGDGPTGDGPRGASPRGEGPTGPIPEGPTSELPVAVAPAPEGPTPAGASELGPDPPVGGTVSPGPGAAL